MFTHVMNKDLWFATATLAGMIIGVGVLGIPYVTAQAGFFVGQLHIVVLAGIVLVLHLMYGEVVERTDGKHRLVGYANVYFGGFAKKFVGISVVLGAYAASLIYIIVAGKFLDVLAPNVFSPILWSVVFWFFGAAAIWLGLRAVGRGELIMTIFLIAAMAGIIVLGIPYLRLENLTGWHPSQFFFPYGVVLFALSGAQVIPEIRAFLLSDGKRFRTAIIAGTLIPAFLYLLFNAAVVGVSGDATSQEAIRGLIPFIGEGVGRLGALFGLLAIATSFLAFGINLKHTFMYDFRMPHAVATSLVVSVPLLLFLFGLREFISIIGITGAVFGALDGIVIAWLYLLARKNGNGQSNFMFEVPRVFVYAVCAVLALGAAYQLVGLFA